MLAFSLMVSLAAAVPVFADYDPHNLNDFGWRTVSTGGRGSLVFQEEPGGAVMSGYEYWSGDSIYVNLYWREKGYTLAYQDGMYGFVDASYIDWGTNTPSYNPKDLSDYGWRTVSTGGRGNLVFQTEPGGSFMTGHSFADGASIYVNLKWREKGYALAYDNGTYGYVDAGYINWGSGTPSGSYNPNDLSDYGWRTVSTGGRGNLVFQTEPGGSFMTGHSFADGASIYVNLKWREKGYAIAYDNGTYGYVDAGYINWGSGAPSYSYDPKDLSDYGWRTVSTGGRGNLVFQTEPGGSFMNNHSFANGASIYVNLNWRDRGYTMAYDNGTYGYVDAGYISW